MELDIKLGYLCNNNCVFCLNKDKKFLSVYPKERIVREIEQVCSRGCEKLVISGGEPLVSPIFWEILEFARSKKINVIEIQTNGRMLSKIEVVEGLKRFEPLAFLVSLHFPSKEEYLKYCNSDGFEEVIRGIKNLISYNCDVTVNTVVMRPNLHRLENLLKLLISLGVKKVNYRFIDGKNVMEQYERFVPRFRECSKTLKKLIEKYSSKIKISLNEFPPCIFPEEFIKYFSPWDPGRINLTIRGESLTTRKILEEQFVYPPKCEWCKYRFMCKGIRKEYHYFYGDDELAPIT